jgi:adenylate cyclase
MSIAVLSFANQTGERGNDVLCEAIADEISGALSRIAELFVLSRRASLGFQSASTGSTQIAQELGVRYVLGGSIRIAGGRVRVATELTDAKSGAQVWADRFDGELTDVFAIQDEIARRVALALQIKLTHGETIRFWEGQTRNLRAWEKMVEAREHFDRYNKIDNAVARRLLREAIDFDPNYTGAIALLGMTHWWDARFNPDLTRDHSLALADEQIVRIQKLDPDLGSGHMLRGAVAFLRDQHDDAIACAERAALLAPSDFHVVAFLGVMRLYNGQYDKAIATLRTAMRINPNFKPWVTYNYALANLAGGGVAIALGAAREYMERVADDRYAYAILALALTANNNARAAWEAVSSMRDRVEELTLQEFRASHRFRDRELLDQLTEWLAAAGLH